MPFSAPVSIWLAGRGLRETQPFSGLDRRAVKSPMAGMWGAKLPARGWSDKDPRKLFSLVPAFCAAPVRQHQNRTRSVTDNHFGCAAELDMSQARIAVRRDVMRSTASLFATFAIS